MRKRVDERLRGALQKEYEDLYEKTVQRYEQYCTELAVPPYPLDFHKAGDFLHERCKEQAPPNAMAWATWQMQLLRGAVLLRHQPEPAAELKARLHDLQLSARQEFGHVSTALPEAGSGKLVAKPVAHYTHSVLPLSSLEPESSAALVVPSLQSFCPALHYFVWAVLGPYQDPVHRILTPHFGFWLVICCIGIAFQGPVLGSTALGAGGNAAVCSLYLVALLSFDLMRRSLATILKDLSPAVCNFSNPHHNDRIMIMRDLGSMTRLVFLFGFSGPLIILSTIAYAIHLYRPSSEGSEGDYRTFTGVIGSLCCFFFASFLLMVQLALLFAVAKLYIFRLRYLFSALLQNYSDGEDVLARELKQDTPPAERRLLAKAPSIKDPSPLHEGAVPYTLRPFAPSSDAVENFDDAPLNDEEHRLDAFLRVYRAMKEEAESHAVSWSVPIIAFLIAYFFVFLLSVVSVIRDMVSGGSEGKPIKLEVIFTLLALGYITVNLAPIISINSTWPKLLAKPQASLSKWSPQQRLILKAYFTEHPMVFPVMGLTFTWTKIWSVRAAASELPPPTLFSPLPTAFFLRTLAFL